jgi:hypothetical protein
VRPALPKRRWWATQGTLAFPVAQCLAELDRQGPGLDGLDSLPASLGVVGAADEVGDPGGLVVVVVGVGRGRAARHGHGRKALVEEAQVLGVVALVGVGGLRDVDQLANQGVSAGCMGKARRDSLGCLGADALQGVPLPPDLFGVGLRRAVGARLIDAAIMRLVRVPKEMRAVRTLQGRKICVSTWSAEARRLG